MMKIMLSTGVGKAKGGRGSLQPVTSLTKRWLTLAEIHSVNDVKGYIHKLLFPFSISSLYIILLYYYIRDIPFTLSQKFFFFNENGGFRCEGMPSRPFTLPHNLGPPLLDLALACFGLDITFGLVVNVRRMF